ncbi:hypothetical protein ISCGN_004488 [Ixodes scapularis]
MYQLAQASTLASFISSTMGPFNCFTVQPCFIVAVNAIAVCNARRFSFHVRHRQLPPEIILLFGGFKPSQGHGVRMCKVLSSEWHRQARFYKECLFFMLQGTTSNGHGDRRWCEYRELADATAEFHWRRMLSELRASAPKRAAPSRSTVHTLGQVSLPESIRRVLDRGPKFAVEPKKSRAELLSLVRHVARKVPEAEAESHCCHSSPLTQKLSSGRLQGLAIHMRCVGLVIIKLNIALTGKLNASQMLGFPLTC